MQFTLIRFEKLFPTGAYANEKITAEVSISIGESPMEAIDAARKLVNENFEKNNPHLVTPEIPIIPKHNNMYPQTFTEPRNFGQESVFKEESLEEQINSCKSPTVLKAVYEKIVKGKPDLEEIYQTKLNELK
jgi:hypothetical protein